MFILVKKLKNWFLHFYELLQDQEEIHVHRFKKGWKLEALNPLTTNQICPATVIRVLDCRYFVVEIDSLTEDPYPIRFSCHSRSKFIFPSGWCKKNDIDLTPPKGKCFICNMHISSCICINNVNSLYYPSTWFCDPTVSYQIVRI